jgi:hypothetical protein
MAFVALRAGCPVAVIWFAGLMVILFQPLRTSMFGLVSSPIRLMFSQIACHNITAEQANLAPFLISMHSTYYQTREITSHARRNMKYD